jgi:hypothetical protein
MIRAYSQRERALLGIALSLYEKLAKSTEKNLKKLNLPDIHVLTAVGNVEAIRTKLGTTGNEIEFTNDLRITAKDAIELTNQRAQQIKSGQEELLMGVGDAEEYEYELKALRRAFSDQIEAFNETTVEIVADGKSTGKVPLSKMKRKLDQMTDRPQA